MEKKQTAVEWFYDKIKSHFEHDGDLLETLIFTMAIAKKKEREQMKLSYDWGETDGTDEVNGYGREYDSFEDYYTQTYGKKFSDLVSQETSQVHEVVKKLKEKKGGNNEQ